MAHSTDTGYDHTVESAMLLMHELTLDNIVHQQTGQLESFVQEETKALLLLSLDDESHVEQAVTDAEDLLADCLLVARQDPCPALVPAAARTTDPRRIAFLRAQPHQVQGSLEWHKFRKDHLTASNIWKCLGSDANIAALIREKCEVSDLKRHMSVSLDSTLHWGHKYEPVSISLYETKYNTDVSEFGCIESPMRAYLAASPDGINTTLSSDRFGRMVEVKNIVNRQITGIPKPEYWVQMQVQMAVCQLEYCDFVETRFVEISDVQFREKAQSQKQVGYMALFLTAAGSPLYEYGDIVGNLEKYSTWNAMVMERHADKQWLKNVFWELDEISIVEVRYNEQWFAAALPYFDRCWTAITIKRETGAHISSPRKRRKTLRDAPPETAELKCLVDIL